MSRRPHVLTVWAPMYCRYEPDIPRQVLALASATTATATATANHHPFILPISFVLIVQRSDDVLDTLASEISFEERRLLATTAGAASSVEVFEVRSCCPLSQPYLSVLMIQPAVLATSCVVCDRSFEFLNIKVISVVDVAHHCSVPVLAVGKRCARRAAVRLQPVLCARRAARRSDVAKEIACFSIDAILS
jgi:hypothetical protein